MLINDRILLLPTDIQDIIRDKLNRLRMRETDTKYTISKARKYKVRKMFDPFGNLILLKRFLISVVGWLTVPRFIFVNKLDIKGTEHLMDLPPNNVIFLSNHQTYFADVMAFYHIFGSVKWGFKNSIKNPFYLLWPKANVYYVAAEETMKGGFLPRLFTLAGAVTVQRSWRDKGQTIDREVDLSAFDKIGKALEQGWVISFPQGTTRPYAPVRKGTAHIVKNLQPIVVPVVINGFRRAFDKKGLSLKKRGTSMSVRFKEPIYFDPAMDVDDIILRVRTAIEQDADALKFKDFK
jgi:1-acyl-sn-glycerol-3-phosphate acyltransferase